MVRMSGSAPQEVSMVIAPRSSAYAARQKGVAPLRLIPLPRRTPNVYSIYQRCRLRRASGSAPASSRSSIISR